MLARAPALWAPCHTLKTITKICLCFLDYLVFCYLYAFDPVMGVRQLPAANKFAVKEKVWASTSSGV
jgi:hypothetical protein